jgi:very long chain acyl-CoA dehydrogenase
MLSFRLGVCGVRSLTRWGCAHPISPLPFSSSPLTWDSSSTQTPKKISFTESLFTGHMNPESCFPFPDVLSDEDRNLLPMVVDSCEKFFQEKNDSLANDLNKTVPDEVMEGLKELGAFGLQVPTTYGGVGLKNTAYARLTEVVGKYDLAVGIVMGAHQSIGFKGILLYGNDEQKAKYLPSLASGENIAAFCLTEPSCGSDAQSIKTRAELHKDGHWVLNGSKLWISNGGFAEIFTVFAQTSVKDPQTGEVKDKVTAFIVERSFGGVTSGPPEDKMGIRASNTAAVYFENVRIPPENVLGVVGGGFKVAMNILNNGRFGMGSSLTGTCKHLISIAVQHATERKQFGSTLKDFGLIKEKIAQMTLKTYALESMAYLVSSMMDKGTSEYQLEAAICKIYGTETSTFVADETLQILGGMGFMRETGVEKIVRDLRIFRIFEGTNEVLRLMIALNGAQQVGKYLEFLINSLKNPFGNISLLSSDAKKRFWRFMNAPERAIQVINSVHPKVACNARAIESCVANFSAIAEKIVRKYRKGIVSEQMILRRMADVSIALFAMAAVTSRASRAVELNLKNADLEVKMSQTFCWMSEKQISILLRELQGTNEDMDLKEIANAVFENGGYCAASPIGLEN